MGGSRLRRSIVWSALAFVAVILATWALFVSSEYGDHIRSAEVMGAGLAGMMEVNTRRTFDMEEMVARTVTDYLRAEGGIAGVRRDLDRHRRYFLELAKALPSRGSIGLIELTGRPLITPTPVDWGDAITPPPPLPEVSYTDRDWFRAILEGRPRFIGRAVMGKLRQEVTYPFSCAFYDAAGQLEGVLVISLRPQAVGRLGLSAEDNARLTVFRTDGAIVARDPIALSDLSVDMSQVSKELHDFSTLSMGSFIDRSPFDGVERVVSFRRMDDLGLIVTAGVDKHRVLRSWRENVYYTGLMVALMLGGLAVAVPMVLRMVDGEAETKAELAAANERLAVLSVTDQLLGIANRRRFDEIIETEWRRSGRTGLPLSLLMIDVDKFKAFNDLFGHQEGDHCLRRVADAVKSAVQRPHDVVARYGGEEFVVILSDTDAEGARAVAERIRAAVWEAEMLHPASPFLRVTISVGVASLVANPGQAASELITLADRALYRAKDLGRNGVQLSYALSGAEQSVPGEA